MKFKPVDFPGLVALLLVVASASAFAVPSSAWRVQFEGAAIHHGNARAIVTAVLEAPEPLQNDGRRLSFTEISNYSAHIRLTQTQRLNSTRSTGNASENSYRRETPIGQEGQKMGKNRSHLRTSTVGAYKEASVPQPGI